MNERSYLDTLNEGSQRKPSTTLEQITQSLQNLESRLGRSRDALDEIGREQPSPQWKQPSYEASPGLRERDMPRSTAPHQQTVQKVEPQATHHSVPSEAPRPHGQEEGAANRVAAELTGLREDLRQEIASNLNREFETLRGEITRMLASSDAAVVTSSLVAEIDRISGAVRNLSERTDDRGVSALRGEIEHVKQALSLLAREDTLRSSDRRWEEFDRRWAAFESRVDARQTFVDPEIAALSARLQAISDAVGNLPESTSMRAIEEHIRMLAGAVEQFVRQQEHQAPETLRLIDQRLDEISRAIVATSVSNAPILDPEPFQRIEARVSAVARQLEEFAEGSPAADMIDRITALTQRFDEFAAKTDLPEQAIERLSHQVLAIAEKIEQTPAASDRELLLNDINERFDVLAAMMERRQGDAMEQGVAMFRDFERRLEDVASRIDQRAGAVFDTAPLMDAIDARFADFADHLSTTPIGADTQAIRNLENRLENISERLDTSASKFAGINSDLMRSLESQIAALSDHLSRPAPMPEFEDIGPRLSELERAVLGSREAIIEAAKLAAEQAVQSFDGGKSSNAAVTGLTEDLKALEDLTRRSGERNNKTFEAIHDTLIKIVDRIGSIDSAESAQPARTALPTSRVMELDDTPPLHGDADNFGLVPSDETLQATASVVPPRLPAEAAADAALAAIGSDAVEQREAVPKNRSLFGGLGRMLSRKKAVEQEEEPSAPSDEPMLAGDPAPEPSLDEPLDPKLANRPLEPGSGAPDLNAIMRRVREERAQNAGTASNETARQDFLAAARRHAQAAAAEAAIANKTAVKADARRGAGIGGILKRYRKPMLLTATGLVVVLAGLRFGQMYLSGGEPVTAAAPLVADQKTDDVPAVEEPANVAAAPVATGSMIASGSEANQLGANLPDLDAGPVTGEAANTSATATATPTATATAEPGMAAAPSSEPKAASAPASTDQPPAVTATFGGVAIPQEIGPASLREAAAAGDAKALFEIGARYADGRGVASDMKQAAVWYEKSAELGFAPAQYRIGNLYEKAVGVDRDVAKAQDWYLKSAEQGNAPAMHNLAVLYAMGADGMADNEAAAKWFKSAADFGIKDSQFNLGILNAKGVGMPRSLEGSYKWFALAAKAGDADAAKKRDEIAASLSPEQLKKAKAEVELWKAKPVNPETNSVELPDSWQDGPTTTGSVDMRKAVSNIQAILNKNGYDAGDPDGMMGEQTKDAIKQFQRDNKMEPTGEVDEKLVRALLDRK